MYSCHIAQKFRSAFRGKVRELSFLSGKQHTNKNIDGISRRGTRRSSILFVSSFAVGKNRVFLASNEQLWCVGRVIVPCPVCVGSVQGEKIASFALKYFFFCGAVNIDATWKNLM